MNIPKIGLANTNSYKRNNVAFQANPNTYAEATVVRLVRNWYSSYNDVNKTFRPWQYQNCRNPESPSVEVAEEVLDKFAHKINNNGNEKCKNIISKAQEVFFDMSKRINNNVFETLFGPIAGNSASKFYNAVKNSGDNVKKLVLSHNPEYHFTKSYDVISGESYLSLLRSVDDKRFAAHLLTGNYDGKTIFSTANENGALILSNKILDTLAEHKNPSVRKYFRDNGSKELGKLVSQGYNATASKYFNLMLDNAPEVALKFKVPSVPARHNIARIVAKNESISKNATIDWLKENNINNDLSWLVKLVKDGISDVESTGVKTFKDKDAFIKKVDADQVSLSLNEVRDLSRNIEKSYLENHKLNMTQEELYKKLHSEASTREEKALHNAVISCKSDFLL